MKKTEPVQPQPAFLNRISLGEEKTTSIKKGCQVTISDNPKIFITNQTNNGNAEIIIDLEDNYVPFLVENDGYGPVFKELDTTSEPNQFTRTPKKGDTIQIFQEPNSKNELIAATVQIVGLRKDGSITIIYSIHKLEGWDIINI